MSDLIGKRVRIKEHTFTPPGLVGKTGVAKDEIKLEPQDDDVYQVRLDEDWRNVFVPVECVEVLP